MFGFFTLVSLVVAFTLGGWWWAGFVFMFLAWLGKRKEAKEQREVESKIEELEQLNDESSRQLSGASLNDFSEVSAEEWPAGLIDACSSLTAHGYYIGDLIPEKKRAAAMANYPLPGDGVLLALIDGTVFGSAAKGLAVGREGIAWKSGSEKPVKILWSYLARSEISSGDFKVSVGTLKFDNSGSGIKLEKVESFLLGLQSYALLLGSTNGPVSHGESKAVGRTSKSVSIPSPIVEINSAEFDELLALPGIGAAEAQMILKRRSERAFSSNTELADYLDLKPHIVTKLDELTDFGPAAGALLPETEPAKSTVANAPRRNTLGGRTID